MIKKLNIKESGKELGLAIFLITLGVFSMSSSFTHWKLIGFLFRNLVQKNTTQLVSIAKKIGLIE